MIRKILTQYQIAEARGHLPKGVSPVQIAFATVLEAGCLAFHKSYHGDAVWNKIASDVDANAKGYEEAMTLAEAFLTDVTRPIRKLREAQTSTDFPLILANVRNQILREQIPAVANSILWDLAEKRTATDFKIMKTYKVTDAEELALRPEGEDVEMSKISMSGEGYSVANYERGLSFTWEMWKNDDLGVFKTGLKRLGVAARKTRIKVMLNAIAGLAATQVGGSAGGPDVDRLVAVSQLLADRKTDKGEPTDLGLTDIYFGAAWSTTAKVALTSEKLTGASTKTPDGNPAQGVAVPHEERMLGAVLGKDWLAVDNNYPWIEVAVLDDFQSGPLTYTEMPTETEHPNQGSFSNHSFAVKVGDALGAKLIDSNPVVRVDGE